MLPTELIATILDHLSPRARLSVRGISARWNDLVLVRIKDQVFPPPFRLLKHHATLLQPTNDVNSRVAFNRMATDFCSGSEESCAAYSSIRVVSMA